MLYDCDDEDNLSMVNDPMYREMFNAKIAVGYNKRKKTTKNHDGKPGSYQIKELTPREKKCFTCKLSRCNTGIQGCVFYGY